MNLRHVSWAGLIAVGAAVGAATGAAIFARQPASHPMRTGIVTLGARVFIVPSGSDWDVMDLPPRDRPIAASARLKILLVPFGRTERVETHFRPSLHCDVVNDPAWEARFAENPGEWAWRAAKVVVPRAYGSSVSAFLEAPGGVIRDEQAAATDARRRGAIGAGLGGGAGGALAALAALASRFVGKAGRDVMETERH